MCNVNTRQSHNYEDVESSFHFAYQKTTLPNIPISTQLTSSPVSGQSLSPPGLSFAHPPWCFSLGCKAVKRLPGCL